MKSKIQKSGFTLIELLVVIAIISLLVSILLPSLTQARRLAYRSLCLANLKGCGFAANLYGNDHHGQLPIWQYGGGLAPWEWSSFLSELEYAESKELFMCPEMKEDLVDVKNDPVAISGAHYITYGIRYDWPNDIVTNPTSFLAQIDLFNIPEASSYFLFADSICEDGWLANRQKSRIFSSVVTGSLSYGPQCRHLGNICFLAADYHAATINESSLDTANITSAYDSEYSIIFAE